LIALSVAVAVGWSQTMGERQVISDADLGFRIEGERGHVGF
jgi:hypothetical protein